MKEEIGSLDEREDRKSTLLYIIISLKDLKVVLCKDFFISICNLKVQKRKKVFLKESTKKKVGGFNGAVFVGTVGSITLGGHNRINIIIGLHSYKKVKGSGR